MEESELLKALKEGDSSLAPLAVSMYGRSFVSYMRQAFPWVSETEQEMICERAIEKAVAKVDRFDESKGTFPQWVRGFIRHEVLDMARGGRFTASIPMESIISSAVPIADSEAAAEKAEDVFRAMRSLSESDQLILTLRTIEGYDYAAIAEQFGVAEDACRQRHRRALTRLRSELAGTETGRTIMKQATEGMGN